jgi:glutathione synthase
MKPLNIAFLMNPLADLDPDGDTSLSIMAECERRHHTVYFLESRDLVLESGRLSAWIAPARTDPKAGLRTGRAFFADLGRLDCLFIRKEPPFDAEYLACLQLLEFLEDRVLIVNRPSGILRTNEKISTARFGRRAPRSWVGSRPGALLPRLRAPGVRGLVVKRIDHKGGAGIFRSSPRDPGLGRKIRAVLNSGSGAVMVQEFIPHRRTGDKRILLLDGKVLGAFTRIPGPRDFRANMSLGGRAARTRLTAADRGIVRALAPVLRRDGIFFAGIDVLDGRLTEINVTSPAGIPEVNGLEGTALERPVLDWVERRVRG